MKIEEKILSPYELVLEEVKNGKVDPYDVDVSYLADLFRKTAQELESSEYLREAGRFLEASAKLLRFQIEEIFPKPEPERRKVTIKEVKEVLEESPEESKYDLSFLYDYTPKVGRPKGAKDTTERKLTWQEFWSQAESVPLHKEVNYHELAREVREKIKRGEFRIKTITDFIAYLFAFYEFEDVPEIRIGGSSNKKNHLLARF